MSLLEEKMRERAELNEGLKNVPQDTSAPVVEEPNVVETSVATDTKAVPNTPVTQVVETKPIYSEFGFNSDDEFKTHYTGLKEKATTYEQDLAKYKTIAEQYENISGDEDMLRVSILKAKGDDRYKLFAKVALGDNISDLDLLKEKYKREFPNKDDKLIEKYILNEYKLNISLPDEDDTLAVEQYNDSKAMAEMKLSKDASDYRSSLMNDFKNIEVPIIRKPTVEQIGLAKEQAQKTWLPVHTELAEVLGKNEYKVKVGEDEVPIVFELTKEQKSSVSKMILDYSKEYMVEYNEQNLIDVASKARDIILRENQNLLVQKVWDEATAYYDRKLDALKGGSSLRDITTTKAAPVGSYESMKNSLLSLGK